MTDWQQELADAHALIGRLSVLLERTANALKGEPEPDTAHSWHDLPEVAAAQHGALAELAALKRHGRPVGQRPSGHLTLNVPVALLEQVDAVLPAAPECN